MFLKKLNELFEVLGLTHEDSLHVSSLRPGPHFLRLMFVGSIPQLVLIFLPTKIDSATVLNSTT